MLCVALDILVSVVRTKILLIVSCLHFRFSFSLVDENSKCFCHVFVIEKTLVLVLSLLFSGNLNIVLVSKFSCNTHG